MKYSSEHFSSLVICLSSITFSYSFSTCSNKCCGTLLPLCCVGVNFSLNVDVAIWFFDPPRRAQSCGYFLNIQLFLFCSIDVSDIRPIVLPVGLDAIRWITS